MANYQIYHTPMCQTTDWLCIQTKKQLPSPFTETTSTLVLTTSSNQYVDIRLMVSTQSPPSSSSTTTKDTLSWGFAGTLSKEATSTKGVTKGIWTHAVDSRTRNVVVDSGFLKDTIDEKGNSQQLEYGQMIDEHVGKVRGYEEMWEDKRVDRGPMVVMTLGNLDDDDKLKNEAVDDGKESKGMLICLGEYLQMVKRTGNDEIVAERWSVSWDKERGEAHCVWSTGDNKESTIGDQVVQDLHKGFDKGQKVTYGKDVWIVVECGSS